MAVDLGDFVDNLRREVNPPGADSFPDATDDDYLGYLQDAFWEARLDGITVLAAWGEVDGSVTPVAVGGTDITNDLVQLLVLFAGIRMLRNQILNTGIGFRAVAGPVQYETTTSEKLLTRILDELRERRNIILTRLSDLGAIPTYYIDSLAERDASLALGNTYWPSEGYGGTSGGSYGRGRDGWSGW